MISWLFFSSGVSASGLRAFPTLLFLHLYIPSPSTIPLAIYFCGFIIRGVPEAGDSAANEELYPLFAKSIKEDMLEYGRTMKSLKDDESLILNIKMTRCVGCGIPSSLELTVKNSILKEYSSGKLTKEAAMQKITEKKGAEQ